MKDTFINYTDGYRRCSGSNDIGRTKERRASSSGGAHEEAELGTRTDRLHGSR